MKRIKFFEGKQKEFISEVLKNSGCPTLKELINRGLDINYSTLKNYYNEKRLMPQRIFQLFLKMGKINREEIKFKELPDSWGQIKGGKRCKKDYKNIEEQRK